MSSTVSVPNHNRRFLLLGKGDGTLQAPIVSPGLPLYAYPLETVVGDFNGDGKPDLVSTASYTPSSLFLSLGNGDLSSSSHLDGKTERVQYESRLRTN